MVLKNQKLNLIVLGTIFILAIEVVWLVYKETNQAKPPEERFLSSASSYFSRLDGTTVSTTEEVNPFLVGVMIDNHPDARPQSGINSARVVYEAPVEGGITRFLGIFNVADDVRKAGPIRSARPYYLDWLAEYGKTSYWHSGGSAEALRLIKQYKVLDADEFFNFEYYTRNRSRSAPHNLYSSSSDWKDFIADNSLEKSNWQGWIFSDWGNNSASSSEVLSLNIVYSSNYQVKWEYDKDANVFRRFLNNRRFADDTLSGVNADTVIIQEMEIEIIDDEGRRTIETVGEGKARVLRDGRLIRATWKKNDRTSRTRFYDENDKEIPLKPGKIWIQIVPQNTVLEVSS